MSEAARQIDFYHLVGSDLGATVAMLSAKIIGAGHKALILCVQPMAEPISMALWETQPDSFLAHGMGDHMDNPHAPLWLVHDPASNPIAADYMVMTGGLEPADMNSFARLFTIFDGTSETELTLARQQWKRWSKLEQVKCRYFAQDESGKWGQKA